MSNAPGTRNDVSNASDPNTGQAFSMHQLLAYTADLQPTRHDSTNHDKRQCMTFANAPLFSIAAQTYAEDLAEKLSMARHPVPQYGLIGSREDSEEHTMSIEDQLIMVNLNVPWSAFICGSQGAGKSHTLSCLLEACLIRNNPTTTLSHPMAGLVFHFDGFTSVSTTQICEAVHLCSSGIPVRVLVTPSNVWNMDRIYRELLQGTEHGHSVEIAPLYLNESQLNITTLLKLMAFDPNGTNTPLYMEVIIRIIREIAMEGSLFTYRLFRERLSATKLFPAQKTALNMRLQLLETFLVPELTPHLRKPAAHQHNIWDFQPGTLTIVDLSDPFLSSDDACTLFSICLAIFLEGRTNCSRVIAIDEAHKFLTQSGAAAVLTEDLTSVIRQQRHIATRVFIATQEPTLSPKLIDLSNATFVHRFSSPSWYKILKEHLAGGGGSHDGASPDHQEGDIFQSITELQTGEALVFCPTAQVCPSTDVARMALLAGRHLRVQIRKRVTFDGGLSLVATAAAHELTHADSDENRNRIRMHDPTAIDGTAGTTQPPAQPLPQHVDHAQPDNRPQTLPTPSSSVPTALPSLPRNYAFETTNYATYIKVKARSVEHVAELTLQFVQRLAEHKAWSRGTVVSIPLREQYLLSFRRAVRVKNTVCRTPQLGVLFRDALEMVLANLATQPT